MRRRTHLPEHCASRDPQVVRLGPAFALSLVLSSVEPALRSAAELGAWQIISPVNVAGKVVEVQGLHEVQDTVRTSP